MKNAIKVVSIVLVTVFVCTGATCFGQSGGRTINSAKALEEYLDSQPANSPDKPISVSMTINDPMLKNVVHVIKSAGKYVSLNISGDALTTIPDFAFIDMEDGKGCGTLVNVTIPASVTSIGDNAFYNCTSLASVTIGKGVTSIGYAIFSGCSSLITININSGNTAYSSTDGVLYNKDKTKLLTYPAGKTNSTFTIPNSVTSIEEGAFYESICLTSVTIPNSVTSIERHAFTRCINLASITIPNSVISIYDDAFYLCINLASVTFEGTIAADNFNNSAFHGDLKRKYLAGGAGTYKITTPIPPADPTSWNPVWRKQ